MAKKARELSKFGIKTYFDPYGDGKSVRKKFKTYNFKTKLKMETVYQRVKKYNDKAGYYSEITLTNPDARAKDFHIFEKSMYGRR